MIIVLWLEPINPNTGIKYSTILADHALTDIETNCFFPMGIESLLKFYNKEMNMDVTTGDGDETTVISFNLNKYIESL